MKAVILANGPLEPDTQLSQLFNEKTLVICADGSASHCQLLGCQPDIIIGDCDSIAADQLANYESAGVTILRHPKNKDATDLELSLDHVLGLKIHQVAILGALGGRWDMSLSNILLAAQARYLPLDISFHSGKCSIYPLHPGRLNTIPADKGQTVSFIPLSGDVSGVTLKGFCYPLHEHRIPLGSTLGVSNSVSVSPATEQHEDGILLCMVLPTHPDQDIKVSG